MELSHLGAEEAVDKIGKAMGFETSWSREDGYTWLTIEGDQVTPEKYKEFSQAIADATTQDFYFSKISCGSMEGALDWDFSSQEKFSSDPDCDISGYGKLFTPAAPQAKPRSPSP